MYMWSYVYTYIGVYARVCIYYIQIYKKEHHAGQISIKTDMAAIDLNYDGNAVAQ